VRVPPGRPRTFAVRRDAPAVVWRVLRHFGYRKKVVATERELCLERRPEPGEHPGGIPGAP
jgi:hypothetical protein